MNRRSNEYASRNFPPRQWLLYSEVQAEAARLTILLQNMKALIEESRKTAHDTWGLLRRIPAEIEHYDRSEGELFGHPRTRASTNSIEP